MRLESNIKKSFYICYGLILCRDKSVFINVFIMCSSPIVLLIFTPYLIFIIKRNLNSYDYKKKWREKEIVFMNMLYDIT